MHSFEYTKKYLFPPFRKSFQTYRWW